MSTYIEKIENHVIHSHIIKLKDEISAVNVLPNNSSDIVELMARITLVIDNFCVALENSNKELVSISWLNEVSNACINLKNQLVTFKSNKDIVALINNSATQMDIILKDTVYLNCVKSSQTFRGVANSTEKYIKSIGKYNEEIDGRVDALKTKIESLEKLIDEHSKKSFEDLSALKSNIDTEKQRLDTFALSYQSQMSDDEKTFIEMKSGFDDKFKESQNERKVYFDQEIEKNIKERKDFNENARQQLDDIKQVSERLISDYDEKFLAFEKKVENIVGIVNSNMFSHKYKEVADDAHKRARIWHVFAIILMLAVSGFAVYAFILTTNQDSSWVRLIAKIFATTTLVTGAAYCARQASKQEKVERYARKIEMELVAIDPFIASLDDERRSVIKEEISRKIFGNADGMEIGTKDEAYTAMDKLTSIEGLLVSITKGLLEKNN